MKSDYVISFEKGPVSPCAHLQTENLECEVEPEEISLKSFKVKDCLENRIWNDDGTLDSKVRMSLMDIADDFWESCGIRWVKLKTVLITGSICNFNWSEYSDIDVHLVVDFSDIHDRKDFVQEYFDEKKNDWNNTHKYLTIYGYPVEFYVEDVGAKTTSGGIFDLWNNEWVKEPQEGNVKPISLNKYAIKTIASEIMTEIDDLCDEFEGEEDKHKIEAIGEECEELLDKIKVIRRMGLKKSGESSPGNITYKVLRRSGYIDKLWGLWTKAYDKSKSIG